MMSTWRPLSSSKQSKSDDCYKQATLVKVKPPPSPPSRKFSSWLSSFTNRFASTTANPTKINQKPTTTLAAKPSAKSISRLTGHDAGIPDCCRRFAKAAFASKQHHPRSAGIQYKYLDRSVLLAQCSVVGGHRVPFLTSHVTKLRQERTKMRALTPVEEDSAAKLCENCHSFQYSHDPRTTCVALSRVVRRLTARPNHDQPVEMSVETPPCSM
ncbi:hypothetical protein DYB25_011074 [Aphanomyces astaci]|uniref:Uncharacterized protein n=1 Tax=Aphanomyces astaci TaxID=112090 RepID=A0A397BG72_APHAT|nr:hypothetical protein DYB25_011074 [Aphanomyces astaci]